MEKESPDVGTPGLHGISIKRKAVTKKPTPYLIIRCRDKSIL
ncbi:hypothetical protein BACFIN_06701 [Bacteroides finegoldii DSM 17565]|nr:hypothetical protein BACFIN_06701 [Bacteroides finegoldii DSM 17565]